METITTSAGTNSGNTNSADETSESERPPPKKARKQLFSFMEEENEQNGKTDDDHDEITRYLLDPCLEMKSNPLQYWKEDKSFPKISKIAEVVLSIPASSAAVERLFSIVGKTYRPDRCRLSDNKFEQLMFIKCNFHII